MCLELKAGDGLSRMKAKLHIISLLLLAVWTALGQGSFIYDQQSSTESQSAEVVAAIQANQPIGQSFTPTLSSVGFIRLQLLDLNPQNGLGAALSINLRTSSITGAILATTDPVLLPDAIPGPATFVDFFFATPVSVVPGTTYYFQPLVQSGDIILIGRFIQGSDYLGGTEYLQGLPGSDDLWFREGITVPEPSSTLLVLFGTGTLVLCRQRRA